MATQEQRDAIKAFARAAFAEQQPSRPALVSPWEKFFPGETISPVAPADVRPFDPFLRRGKECIFLRRKDGAVWYLEPGEGDPMLTSEKL
jgi:hypothetical protein